MTAYDHYRAAEALLLSCQVPGTHGETPEQYPAREDDADSVGHALAAAQVHATLALAATRSADVPPVKSSGTGLCTCSPGECPDASSEGLRGTSKFGGCV